MHVVGADHEDVVHSQQPHLALAVPPRLREEGVVGEAKSRGFFGAALGAALVVDVDEADSGLGQSPPVARGVYKQSLDSSRVIGLQASVVDRRR